MRVGNLLIVIGAAVLVIGALIRFAPGLFAWFGHLPGDIRIEGEKSRVYVPVVSMVIVSVALTVVANIVAWLMRNR